MRISSPHTLTSHLYLALVSLLTLFVSSNAIAQTDAADEYLTGYMLLQDAESLEKAGDLEEAFKKYKRASDIFDAVYTKYPNWEPRMVGYRRKKIQESMSNVYDALPAKSSLRSRAADRSTEKLARPRTNPTTYNPGGNLIAQKDRIISELTTERDTLIQELNQQSTNLDAARDRLATSERAQKSIQQKLFVAEQRAQQAVTPENTADVNRLKQELSIANDTITANDKRLQSIKTMHDKALTEIKQLKQDRDKITKEYAQLKEILEKNQNGDMKKLIAENEDLRGQLQDAQKQIQDLKGDNATKDQEIASLKGKLKSVEGQLAKIKAENEEYRTRIQGLTTRLKQTQQELADTQTKSRDAINAEMQKENKILQGIIVRQLKQQARRHQAKQLVLNELSKLEVQSSSLMANIDRLSGASFAMTDEERDIFKAPIFRDMVDEVGGMSATIFTEAGVGKILELPDSNSNDGDKNQYGLNHDMTQFAKAAALDFFRGKFEDAESTYQQILKIVPDNIYTLRNQGIVKTRLDKLEEAETLFRKAIAYDSKDDYSHLLHGSFNYRLKKLDKARASMLKVVELNPKNGKAHNYLGAISLMQGDEITAMKHFQDVVKVDPKFADAHFNLAYLLLEKDRNAAREHYTYYLKYGGKEDKAMAQKLGS